MVNCIWMLVNEFDCLHGNLSSFKRIIRIGTEFAPISLTIAIADGVTVAAHWPGHSSDHLNPCSATSLIATILSISEGINNKQPFNLCSDKV